MSTHRVSLKNEGEVHSQRKMIQNIITKKSFKNRLQVDVK